MRDRGLVAARLVSGDGWVVVSFSVNVIALHHFSPGHFSIGLPRGMVQERNGLMEGPYFVKVSIPIWPI